MKELEDHNWFPPVLRNFQTEFIGFVVARFNIYDAFIDHLKIVSLPAQPMTDLCSGSGEPAISIYRKSNCFSSLVLSDKYPNPLQLSDHKISYEMLSTDVLEMEFKHGTCYTMFNSFHHFNDKDKLKIVEKIQTAGSVSFLVEILEPTLFCLLKVIITTTIGTLLLSPFVLPFSLKRLFFTYIFPLNILTITMDGIVSVLKSRSVKQYQKLFAKFGNTIKIFRLKNGLSPLIVIQIQAKK
ncbi:MAG: hypothetical protein Q8M29_03390 [Bacteroidota bacterium]|nr:hypothetical protein [Bacteroidota bacterium]